MVRVFDRVGDALVGVTFGNGIDRTAVRHGEADNAHRRGCTGVVFHIHVAGLCLVVTRANRVARRVVFGSAVDHVDIVVTHGAYADLAEGAVAFLEGIRFIVEVTAHERTPAALTTFRRVFRRAVDAVNGNVHAVHAVVKVGNRAQQALVHVLVGEKNTLEVFVNARAEVIRRNVFESHCF